MEEMERVSDLPEVTQQVGGKARILPLPPAPVLFPPPKLISGKRQSQQTDPRSSYPGNFKIHGL